MQQIIRNELVKLQPKGLITIPKKLRRSLGFEENGIVRLTTDKGRLIVEPVRTLPYPVRTYSDTEIQEFIEFDKVETKKISSKGRWSSGPKKAK